MARNKTYKTDRTPEPIPQGMTLTHLWIRRHLDADGMKTEAALEARRAFAAEVLRSGEPLNQKTRDAIAELLEPERRGRGRPAKPPMKWYEVGLLLSDGKMTQQQVAEKLAMELRAVQRGWQYYKQAKKAHDDVLKYEDDI